MEKEENVVLSYFKALDSCRESLVYLLHSCPPSLIGDCNSQLAFDLYKGLFSPYAQVINELLSNK